MKGLWRQFLPLFLVIARLLPAQTPETPASANTPVTDAVPRGTTLHIRLRQTISSFGSKQDTPISAIVIQPVELDGQIVLPMNTELRGVVARVRRVGVGLSHETALLDLQFDTLILPESQPQPLAGQITAVDNSRETVDPQGMIHGIRATASTAKVLSGPISSDRCRLWKVAASSSLACNMGAASNIRSHHGFSCGPTSDRRSLRNLTTGPSPTRPFAKTWSRIQAMPSRLSPTRNSAPFGRT